MEGGRGVKGTEWRVVEERGAWIGRRMKGWGESKG